MGLYDSRVPGFDLWILRTHESSTAPIDYAQTPQDITRVDKMFFSRAWEPWRTLLINHCIVKVQPGPSRHHNLASLRLMSSTISGINQKSSAVQQVALRRNKHFPPSWAATGVSNPVFFKATGARGGVKSHRFLGKTTAQRVNARNLGSGRI
ncbi:hypothetical protein FQN55_003127 [Onygenales sp. PD_40]|nr:hypothetical protein FQN55_003127 [Onygenales sp. PD_40]KAK2798449.1 hypothetical protein FQN51_007712 [Onygenales sp. PD_10]